MAVQLMHPEGASWRTDADGQFAFVTATTWGPETIRLRVDTHRGWKQTTPTIVLDRAQPHHGMEIGIANMPATIKATIYEDLNGNGVRDNGEPLLRTGNPLSGQGLLLTGHLRDMISYSQPNVSETLASGPRTLELGSYFTSRFDITDPPASWQVNLVEGQELDLGEIGLRPKPTLFHGKVLLDPDLDHDDEDADIPLEGARVYVDLDGDTQWDADEPSTLTSVGGVFSLEVEAFRLLYLRVADSDDLALMRHGKSFKLDIGETIEHTFMVRRHIDPRASLPTDYNNNGKVDWVARTPLGMQLNSGQHLFHYYDVQLTPPGDGFVAAAVTDLNRDGHTDVVWRHATTGANIITLLNSGQTTEQVSLPAVADANWRLIDAGDFNRDGHYDLLWRHAGSGAMTVWAMNGTTLNGFLSLPQVRSTDWQMIAAVDLDYDGDADLFWQNTATNTLLLWRMNDHQIEGFKTIGRPKSKIEYRGIVRSDAYQPLRLNFVAPGLWNGTGIDWLIGHDGGTVRFDMVPAYA
jgi:hypothetical protein